MKTNPFPVIGTNANLHPWNIHRLNLVTLPVLHVKTPSQKKWLGQHLRSMLSAHEHAIRIAHEDDVLMHVKDSLTTIFVLASGVQGEVCRVFRLAEKESNNSDTIIFISNLRFDLSSDTVVCDGYVVPLTRKLVAKIQGPISKLVESMITIPASKVANDAWKRLLPPLVEHCRSWTHAESCEYISQGRVPLSVEMECDPLCSCGKGKDVDGMRKKAEWATLAQYAVPVAFSPLFAVS
ncbi:hypothetical protein B0H14DRAFT_3562782, partial [Mycena olivaceomarginata]